VAKNAEALRLARTGLGRECLVPLSSLSTNVGMHIADLVSLKRLAQAFTAEGRLAEMENRPSDAAASCLDTIRLGHKFARGGALMDAWVGTACQATGMPPLENLSATLDAKRCREAAAALETAESKGESATAVLRQERAWSRQIYGLKTEFLHLIYFKQRQASEQ